MALASYEFLSVVQGHHVYKDIWMPVIDDVLAAAAFELDSAPLFERDIKRPFTMTRYHHVNRHFDFAPG